jgi:hypothetical protein
MNLKKSKKLFRIIIIGRSVIPGSTMILLLVGRSFLADKDNIIGRSDISGCQPNMDA